MKFILFFVLSLGFSVTGWAAFNETLNLKQVSEDGNQFVFVRKQGPAPWNGITIKDPHTKVILYEARVTKCSATACVGIVVHNHSGIKLRTDEEYLHSYNETPLKVETPPSPLPKPVEAAPPAPEPEVVKAEPVEPPKPVEVFVAKKKEAPKKPSELDTAWYGSYGSPIGPGFKVGYYKKKNSAWLGLNYANIASTTSNVTLKGHLLSGAASYTLIKVSPMIDLNLLGELGLAKASINFKAVAADGPIKDETSYFGSVAGEGKFNFGQFSAAIKSGMSKAGFAPSYTGEVNKFNNPYGTVLVFLEIGAYYCF